MNTKKPLTNQQQKVYSKLTSYILHHSYSPTLAELKEMMNIKSLNSVTQYLLALENKGYIFRKKGLKRNIEIRNIEKHKQNMTISIPIVASVGCDDLSVFANEENDGFIEVDANIIKNKKKVVAVRAVGNSMNDAGIYNGDYVLIEKTSKAKNGDRIAAVVGDMLTIKRLEQREGLIVLWPESKDKKYRPIIVSEGFKIAGKVILSIPGDSMDLSEVVPL